MSAAPTPPASSSPTPSASPSESPEPSPSAEPAAEGIDTSGWLEYAATEGDASYRYPADWTLAAEAEPNAHAEPGLHTTWDSATLTAPDEQTLLRSGDFADIGGACTPGSGRPFEVLATEPSPVLSLDDDGESMIATVAFPRLEGGWTFGVGITSAPFLSDGVACSVYFVSRSSSGGVWFGTQQIVGSAEEGSELWEIDSLDAATAYMETDEYATILEPLRSEAPLRDGSGAPRRRGAHRMGRRARSTTRLPRAIRFRCCGSAAYGGPMTRILGIVLGVILIAAGGLFFLQGIGVVGGSSMTNTTTWSVLGPLIALVGLVVLLVTLRRTRRR